MTNDPNEQTVEMIAILALTERLRKHIRDDRRRFDRIKTSLSTLKVRVSMLIPLCISAAVAAYFGAHGG